MENSPAEFLTTSAQSAHPIRDFTGIPPLFGIQSILEIAKVETPRRAKAAQEIRGSPTTVTGGVRYT